MHTTLNFYLTLTIDVYIASTPFLRSFYTNAFKQVVDISYIFWEGKLREYIWFDNGLLGEVQQNPGTTFVFLFLFGVWLLSKTKLDKSTIPTGNIVLIYILYQIILIIEYSVLLGGLELVYEVPNVYGVYARYIEFISDEDSILYGRH